MKKRPEIRDEIEEERGKGKGAVSQTDSSTAKKKGDVDSTSIQRGKRVGEKKKKVQKKKNEIRTLRTREFDVDRIGIFLVYIFISSFFYRFFFSFITTRKKRDTI